MKSSYIKQNYIPIVWKSASTILTYAPHATSLLIKHPEVRNQNTTHLFIIHLFIQLHSMLASTLLILPPPPLQNKSKRFHTSNNHKCHPSPPVPLVFTLVFTLLGLWNTDAIYNKTSAYLGSSRKKQERTIGTCKSEPAMTTQLSKRCVTKTRLLKKNIYFILEACIHSRRQTTFNWTIPSYQMYFWSAAKSQGNK